MLFCRLTCIFTMVDEFRTILNIQFSFPSSLWLSLSVKLSFLFVFWPFHHIFQTCFHGFSKLLTISFSFWLIIFNSTTTVLKLLWHTSTFFCETVRLFSMFQTALNVLPGHHDNLPSPLLETHFMCVVFSADPPMPQLWARTTGVCWSVCVGRVCLKSSSAAGPWDPYCLSFSHTYS